MPLSSRLASSVQGACLCNGVVWTLAPGARVAQILSCNCSYCRKQTGCQSAAFAAFPRKSLQFDHKETMKEFKVSDVATRHFCSGCGALVMMDYMEEHTLWMTLGLLDNECLESLVDDYQERLKLAHVDGNGEAGSENHRCHAYPPSHVFSESASAKMRELLKTFPEMDKFGNYVPDSCEETAIRKVTGSWADSEQLNKQAS